MLFATAYFIDLIFPFLVWAGVESVHIAPGKSAFTPLDFAYYPYSHSLLMALVWALAFALAYLWWRGDRRGTWMVFALVLSHWVLDFISHVPDLPLAPGVEFKVGLGLWNSKLATVLVEGGLFVAGVLIYLFSTRATRTRGTIALWAFLLFIALSYLGNLNSPPPNTTVLLVAILLSWFYLPWLAWVERNRRLVPSLEGKGDPG
jgi:hypothetical protein